MTKKPLLKLEGFLILIGSRCRPGCPRGSRSSGRGGGPGRPGMGGGNGCCGRPGCASWCSGQGRKRSASISACRCRSEGRGLGASGSCCARSGRRTGSRGGFGRGSCGGWRWCLPGNCESTSHFPDLSNEYSDLIRSRQPLICGWIPIRIPIAPGASIPWFCFSEYQGIPPVPQGRPLHSIRHLVVTETGIHMPHRIGKFKGRIDW
jgi:hypothetical protein